MSTKFLYSNIWPLNLKRGQESIRECFLEELAKADEIRISVAYFSIGSLLSLDELIESSNIKKVCLILGMYGKKDFPESSYEIALSINEKWQRSGIGEIRMTKDWRYHGKLYCFLRNNQIFSAITGSANLSFLHLRKYPQYEEAVFIEDPETLNDSLEHINDLLASGITENIHTWLPPPEKDLNPNF
ncbi:restriction endonuclease PLD domain-containing protein [Mycoplasma wenyonii]|uniref:restriction endonuclease PLD domain-containing protein n=1 Tax=Mycoplasma wenyonii TaxID=65123 RepID=UPI0002FBF9E3|nr:restriction endonuclease PLD domain-containing protein [Mycoplasma wenyonii]